MDLEQLKGFYFTARFRSFTAAAKKLYLTQPAISLKVKALEEEVGEKLIERVRRSIRLTAAGQVLYDHAEDLLGKFEELERVAHDLKELERGRLAIGASDTTSIYFLPELLKEFRSEHPHVELEIQSEFSSNVVEKVIDRDVDVGVVTLPQEHPRLEVVQLFSQRLVCIVDKGHRFCDLKAVRLADLADEPLILLGKSSLTRQRIDASLARAATRLRVVLELSSFEIIKHYVAAGHGISLVPERAVELLLPGLAAIALRTRIRIDVGAIYRADRALSRPARVFLERALAHFRPERGSRRDLANGAVEGPSRN